MVDLGLLFALPCLLAAVCVAPDLVQEFLREQRGPQGPTEVKQGLMVIFLLCELFWIRKG